MKFLPFAIANITPSNWAISSEGYSRGKATCTSNVRERRDLVIPSALLVALRMESPQSSCCETRRGIVCIVRLLLESLTIVIGTGMY